MICISEDRAKLGGARPLPAPPCLRPGSTMNKLLELPYLVLATFFTNPFSSLAEFWRCIDWQPSSRGRVPKFWGDQPSKQAAKGIGEARSWGTFRGWECCPCYRSQERRNTGRSHHQLQSAWGIPEALLHREEAGEEAKEANEAKTRWSNCSSCSSHLVEEQEDPEEEATLGWTWTYSWFALSGLLRWWDDDENRRFVFPLYLIFFVSCIIKSKIGNSTSTSDERCL